MKHATKNCFYLLFLSSNYYHFRSVFMNTFLDAMGIQGDENSRSVHSFTIYHYISSRNLR